ncbi:MAG: ABC transporter substrate-binding protein [Symbiobacteriaceae bacterium]|nr:ABC transporter substrate-binding protein [Symbiobacteriaceae bacterium]
MSKKLLSLLMVAIIVMTAACNPAPAPTSPPTAAPTAAPTEPPPPPKQEEKIYRTTFTADIRTLNPHTGTQSVEDGARADLSPLLFMQAIEYDAAGNPVAPVWLPVFAAELPIALDDGYNWEIKLNPDGVWENGEPVDADTWMYTFKMYVDPTMFNPYGSWLFRDQIEIVNAEAYYLQNQAGNDPVAWEDVGITKVDDYTIHLSLTSRYRQDDVIRHFGKIYAVYEPLYESLMNESRTQTTYGTDKASFLSGGPYILESWTIGSERLYKKNPLWPHADMINLDGVLSTLVPDSNAAQLLFENGEIDVLGVTAAMYEGYREDPRLLITPSGANQILYANVVNPQVPILADLNMRKALYHAVDRESVAKLVNVAPWATFMHGNAGGPRPGVGFWDTPEAQALIPDNWGFDPELAKQYFDTAYAAAGLSGKLVLEFMYSETSEVHKSVIEFLQAQWAIIFGQDLFELRLVPVPSPAILAAQTEWPSNPNSYQLSIQGLNWPNTMYYPNQQFKFYCNMNVDGLTFTDFESMAPDMPEMYLLSLTEEYRMDSELLYELSLEMEKYWMDNMFGITLYRPLSFTIYSDRIVLPVTQEQYSPLIGWGTRWMDIDLTK